MIYRSIYKDRKLTEEDVADIRCQYRNAADKKKQIKIFSELYMVSTGKILEVLGIEEVPRRISKREMKGWAK